MEFSAELPLKGEVGSRALDVLRRGDIPGAGHELGETIAREAKAEYSVFDTKLADETTTTDLVVVNFGTQNTDQVNVLDSLHRKPAGSTVFQEVDCRP